MAKDSRLSKRQLKKLVKEQGRVVEKDPGNLVARLKLAGALQDLGKETEALAHYLEVARVYVDTGKLVQAISVYKGILRLKPGHQESEIALSRLLAKQSAPGDDASDALTYLPPYRVELPPEPPRAFSPPPPFEIEVAEDDDADLVLLAEEPSEDELLNLGFFEEEETTSPGPTSYNETIRQSALGIDLEAIEARQEGRAPAQRHTLLGVPPAESPDLPETPLVEVPSLHEHPTGEYPAPLEAVIKSPLARPTPAPGVASAENRRTIQMEREPDFLAMDSMAPGEPVGRDDEKEETLSSVFDHEEEALWSELEGSVKPRRKSASRSKSKQTLRASPAPPPETGSAGGKPKEGKQKRPRKSSKMTIPMGAAAFEQAIEEQEATGEHMPTTAGVDGEVRLEEIALFRDLSESSREMLRSRIVTRVEDRGATIVREGDPGNALFVVSSGQVRVTKRDPRGQEVELATLGPGAFFGEFALLSDRKRHATVTVSEEGVFFEISRKVISDLTKSDPSFGNTLRQFYRRRLLGTLIRSAPFFDPLTPEERKALMGKLRFRRIPEQTRIITEGEPGGGFFLILIGEVEVTRSQPAGPDKVLSRLVDGSYFGEMSLLKGGNAVATVTTITPTEIVQLAADEFYRILSKYPQIWEEVNREAKRRELANLEILTGSSPGTPSDNSVVL